MSDATSPTTTPATTTPAATAPTTTAPARDHRPTTITPAAPVVGQFACIPAGEQPETWEVRPPSDIPSPVPGEGWTTAVFGRSVQGRAIEALVRPVDAPRRRVVVIGGLHGNEPVTPPAVRGLLEAHIDADVEVWLVPVANPDGSAAGLRCNANSVDLNRNFAWEWRAEDGGPAPSSEPETQALTVLVEGLHPDVVVWVHQPLGYVSAIGATDDATRAGMVGRSRDARSARRHPARRRRELVGARGRGPVAPGRDRRMGGDARVRRRPAAGFEAMLAALA